MYVFQLVAVFDEVHAGRTASPSESMSNGYSSPASPESLHYFPHLDYKDPIKGEIEVNEAILKASTCAFDVFLFCSKIWLQKHEFLNQDS